VRSGGRARRTREDDGLPTTRSQQSQLVSPSEGTLVLYLLYFSIDKASPHAPSVVVFTHALSLNSALLLGVRFGLLAAIPAPAFGSSVLWSHELSRRDRRSSRRDRRSSRRDRRRAERARDGPPSDRPACKCSSRRHFPTDGPPSDRPPPVADARDAGRPQASMGRAASLLRALPPRPLARPPLATECSAAVP